MNRQRSTMGIKRRLLIFLSSPMGWRIVFIIILFIICWIIEVRFDL